MIDELDLREMLERRVQAIQAIDIDTPTAVRRARGRLARNWVLGAVLGIAAVVGIVAGVRRIEAAPIPADLPTPTPFQASSGARAYAEESDLDALWTINAPLSGSRAAFRGPLGVSIRKGKSAAGKPLERDLLILPQGTNGVSDEEVLSTWDRGTLHTMAAGTAVCVGTWRGGGQRRSFSSGRSCWQRRRAIAAPLRPRPRAAPNRNRHPHPPTRPPSPGGTSSARSIGTSTPPIGSRSTSPTDTGITEDSPS